MPLTIRYSHNKSRIKLDRDIGDFTRGKSNKPEDTLNKHSFRTANYFNWKYSLTRPFNT